MPTVAKKTAQARKDAPRRHPDYSVGYDAMKNTQDDRHYVGVDPNTRDGTSFYEALGYRIEVYDGPDSPSWARGRKKEIGKPHLSAFGEVIMSIDLETLNFLKAEKRKDVDRKEARMIKGRKQNQDGFRGLAGSELSTYAETSMSEGEVKQERFTV